MFYNTYVSGSSWFLIVSSIRNASCNGARNASHILRLLFHGETPIKILLLKSYVFEFSQCLM